MANGDSKNKVEIEVAIRDMFSTTLKTMGRELDVLNKRAAETGVTGSAGFDKFRRSNDQLYESNKRTSASFSAMQAVTQTLSRSLIGTAGLAAGFYQVAKSLEEVSVNAIRMKNFSIDTGLATSKIQDLQQTLRRGGFSKGEGDSVIGAMGSMVNNLRAFRESSEIYQALIKAPGGGGIASNLLAIAKTGDNAKVVTEYLKAFNRQTVEGKYYMAQAAGTTVSAMQQMAEAAEKNRNIKLWPIDQADADKMHQIWVDLEVQFENIFRNISMHGIKAFGELSDALKSQGVTTRGIADWINADTDKFVTYMKATMADIKAIKQWYDDLKNDGDIGKAFDKAIGATGAGDSPEKRRKNFEDYIGIGGGDKKFPQGEDPMGRDYSAGNDNAGPRRIKWQGGTSGSTDFSGRARDDGVNLLTDIRDTLQRIELGGEGSGSGARSGGSSGASGEGSGGSAGVYGLGARASGGSLRSGLGGFRAGGGGGSRGDRNNNPGNLKFGPHAKAFGATHADAGGFAVFPDAESGAAAQETLLKSDKYKGLTLHGFAQKYAEGSASWEKTVGKEMGLGSNDIVDNQSTNLPGAIRKAEGTGSRGAAGDGSGGGVPSAILSEARFAALKGGPGEVQKYIQSRGYNVNSAWCGDFAAAVVSGAGGTPPKNPSIASSWRNFGHAVDEPQPGDIAVRKNYNRGGGRVPTGEAGSHVTIVDQVDENGRFTGIGGNQSRRRSSFPISGYEFRRGDENRATVDQAQSNNPFTKGAVNAKIEFMNQWPGVRTSAAADGDIFKELQITKTKQSGVYRQDGQAYD